MSAIAHVTGWLGAAKRTGAVDSTLTTHMMTYRQLSLIAVLLFILIAIAPYEPPTLIRTGGAFQTHVLRGTLAEDIIATLDAPSGTLAWHRDTGLQLPDSASRPLYLAELIVLDHTRPVTVYTLYRVTVQDGVKRVPLVYAWQRYSTQWRTADYNPQPQPHGDAPVAVYPADVVESMLRAIDEDMLNDPDAD